MISLDFGLPKLPRMEPHWNEVIQEQNAFHWCQDELRDSAMPKSASMNEEQTQYFTTITNQITNCGPLQPIQPIFIEGKPGHGPLLDAIVTFLRGQDHIVLVVTSTGLAASLYEHDQTAHSMFKIPAIDVHYYPHYVIKLKLIF
ncbi:hypothetical protein M422DRAFT_251591 [Sphaerobolus stellatus SS14]|uniref:ATP-dependent DNA helicase n=1 Tax=Sphaerobolus stellatus (strain SS14) TaxID=990650 RepID=A0A0C9VD92_SPHS4|nr:hypothetical protein M422DRAFT_251591 [Sphaerobolus stellatus SS14]